MNFKRSRIISTALVLLFFFGIARSQNSQSLNGESGYENASVDPSLDDALSPSGPLISAEEARTVISSDGQKRTRRSANTYTYIRCYYQDPVPENERSGLRTEYGRMRGYEWALNSDGSYYRLNGYWGRRISSNGVNVFMYYTDTSQREIGNACERTISSKTVGKLFAKSFAANNRWSYNYSVWRNGENEGNSTYDRIISFGDSLSDNQNFFNITEWLAPNRSTWSLGRFSNGKVWTEYLADEEFHIPLYNWAVGYSGTESAKYNFIKGIGDQVDSFLESIAINSGGYRIGRSLFTVFTGANDIMTFNVSPPQIVSRQKEAIVKLLDQGAMNILVMNMPNISKAPRYINDSKAAELEVKVNQVNSGLAAMVDELKAAYGQGNVRIVLFDTHAAFSQVIDNPRYYGIENALTSCINYSNAGIKIDYISSFPTCANPDKYVFWDAVHPSSIVHRILAAKVYVALFVRNPYFVGHAKRG
ncbi:SGNH/GDSL hydrolase family protein [Burkholderia ubonensis]|uniref:SGNH/GDSL hydrolase family protein n=1 Tax=Burkholderia ubonensis TaxID=101571 RepID=UPI0009B399C6|nr:SGNH/GDSL hydrolase family protein [Burkholderia ubonensis]